MSITYNYSIVTKPLSFNVVPNGTSNLYVMNITILYRGGKASHTYITSYNLKNILKKIVSGSGTTKDTVDVNVNGMTVTFDLKSNVVNTASLIQADADMCQPIWLSLDGLKHKELFLFDSGRYSTDTKVSDGFSSIDDDLVNISYVNGEYRWGTIDELYECTITNETIITTLQKTTNIKHVKFEGDNLNGDTYHVNTIGMHSFRSHVEKVEVKKVKKESRVLMGLFMVNTVMLSYIALRY